MNKDFPKLDDLDEKMCKVFAGKIVRKAYARFIPEFQRLPDYVVEFLISQYADQEGFLRDDAINKIVNDINNYIPEKREKELIKHRALSINHIEIIDRFSVTTDLRRGKYMTRVEALDTRATVDEVLVSQKGDSDLLRGGLWGKASFLYTPGGDGTVLNMNEFKAYQQGRPILSRYISTRRKFTTDEWIDLLIKTIGLEPGEFDRPKKLLYITRLIPYVEPLVNLIELGPPGTGKSFVYENLSSYSRLVLGGDVTPARLIFNQNTKENGILFKYDVVCFDEINKSNKSVIKELVPKLQQVMASGNIERGDMDASTTVSLVYQGNPKDKNGNILHGKGVFSLGILPEPMRDTPFLDRINGYIHGWEFDAVSDKIENLKLGLLSSYFYEIMHLLRRKTYSTLIRKHVEFTRVMSSGEKRGMAMRDLRSVKKLLSGFIKLVYPHGELTDVEWEEAATLVINLRQSVLKEMSCLCDGYDWTIEFNIMSTAQPPHSIGGINTGTGSVPAVNDEVFPRDVPINTPRANEISSTTTISEVPESIKAEEHPTTTTTTTTTKDLMEESLMNRSQHPASGIYEFGKIFTNEGKYLAMKIPYWYFKLLADENSLVGYHTGLQVQNPKVNIKVQELVGCSVLKDIGATINFETEEDGLPACHKSYKELVQKLDNIISLFPKVDVIKAKVDIDGEKGRALYEMVDAIKIKLQNTFGFSSRVKFKDYRDSLEGEMKLMESAVTKAPDLLSLQGYDPIIPCNDISAEIIEKIAVIEEAKTSFMNIIDENKHLLDVPPVTREATLFKGKRFPLYAIDINHLHICLKKKLISIHPGLRLMQSEVENEFKKLFQKRLLPANKPYLFLFFAGKHYEENRFAYKRLFPDSMYMKWFIESTVKSKDGEYVKYVDTDQVMISETTKFIERHANQISELHIGSGDKDMYLLFGTAKEHGIRSYAFTIQESNLSWKLKEVADETYLLFP
ncbi:MAG: BREX system Lon protease-like protein BrxL [Promethearchaeota archaeon]